MRICGPKVTLRAANFEDRKPIWEWAARSDLTVSMMGLPEFPENPVPTYLEHLQDYTKYFFDGSRPDVGRSFIIEHDGQAVGHLSYSRGDERPRFAELDIWMRDSTCCGHGWGSEALTILCEYLHTTHGKVELILRPSARNLRAIRSYERAGFAQLMLPRAELESMYGPGEYRDTVVLRRVISDLNHLGGQSAGAPASGISSESTDIAVP